MVNEEIILNEMICFTSCPVFIDFHLERCGVAMIADDKEMKGFLPVALVVTRQIFLWNEASYGTKKRSSRRATANAATMAVAIASSCMLKTKKQRKSIL